MRSFNEKFNRCCVNYAFWHDLSVSLESVEAQLIFHGGLSREDRKIHRAVSTALAEIMHKVAQAEDYHARQLNRLRGDYLNER